MTEHATAPAETGDNSKPLPLLPGLLTPAEMPVPTPLDVLQVCSLDTSVVGLLEQNRREILAKSKDRLAQGSESANPYGRPYQDYLRFLTVHLPNISRSDLQGMVDLVNGTSIDRALRPELRAPGVLIPLLAELWNHDGRAASLPQFSFEHVLRLSRLICSDTQSHIVARQRDGRPLRELFARWYFGIFRTWRERHEHSSLDLRHVARLIEHVPGGMQHALESSIGHQRVPDLTRALTPEHLWPWFAERPHVVDQVLGLVEGVPRQHASVLVEWLRVLSYFPSLPSRWLEALLQMAIEPMVTVREPAQALLEQYDGLDQRILELCSGAPKTHERLNAIHWAARRRPEGLIPILRARLVAEKSEHARAAILSVLESLGEPISEWLTPEALEAEAASGLGGGLPANLAWLDFASLPELQWRNGRVVSLTVVQWWCVLAVKLKTAEGHPLLCRYLDALSPGSAMALGHWLLQTMSAWDTTPPNEADARKDALLRAPADYLNTTSYSQGANIYNLDYIVQLLFDQNMNSYPNSISNIKGLFALTVNAPVTTLLETFEFYTGNHHVKRAAIFAILDVIATRDEEECVQKLLSLARRSRTAAIRKRALELVSSAAERLGWAEEEVEDRTIATAGLEQNGTLCLSYGSRTFVIGLDARLRLTVASEDGTTHKQLPAPRPDEDPDTARAAADDYKACKSAVRVVAKEQTERLYEAVCAQRDWNANDARQWLWIHPVVSRLCTRCVWWVEHGNGVRQWVRPLPDGTAVHCDGDVAEIAPTARVGLAHAAIMDEGPARQWDAHFKRNKVRPLLGALDRTPATWQPGDTMIMAPEGRLTDTSALCDTLFTAGYRRGVAMDGDVFDRYLRDFPYAGVKASIHFSGAGLLGVRWPAVVYSLCFFSISTPDDQTEHPLLLSEVPPILVFEAQATLDTLVTNGVDEPNWRSKLLFLQSP